MLSLAGTGGAEEGGGRRRSLHLRQDRGEGEGRRGGVKKRPVHISEAGTSEGNGAGGRGEGISGHTRWVKSCAT